MQTFGKHGLEDSLYVGPVGWLQINEIGTSFLNGGDNFLLYCLPIADN